MPCIILHEEISKTGKEVLTVLAHLSHFTNKDSGFNKIRPEIRIQIFVVNTTHLKIISSIPTIM